MMLFMPGDRVSSLKLGVGTVTRSTIINPSMEDSSSLYIVRFDDDGNFVAFSEGAAYEDLAMLEDNDYSCPFCEASLQGAPIDPADQATYNATHFSRKVSIIDSDTSVATMCPDCETVWSNFTYKRIKRLAPFWTKMGGFPQPISEFGPLHLWNIRRFRRKRASWAHGDSMDKALTREIRRYWPILPVIIALAPLSRALHDRKMRQTNEPSQRHTSSVSQIKGERIQ